MAYSHVNRRGDVYLLQMSKAANGKPRYYLGRKLTGTAVEEVPAGYEVFESPERAQVYLRKERPTRIAPIEREIVTEGVRRLSAVPHFLVDVEDDCLIVYLPTRSVDDANRIVRELAGPDALRMHRFQLARDAMIRESDHEQMMRFELVDQEQRLFQVDHWCFRSFCNDWLRLGGPACLSDLVEQYAPHLAEDSFFELC